MPQVNTVLGPISPENLGRTLIHEHVVAGLPGWFADATVAPFDRQAALSIAARVFEELKAVGVRTVVDATPADLGRDPELLKEVSLKTGVNIVCSTGLYKEDGGTSAYFRMRSAFADGVSEICELFHREITEGIRDTGVKAGAIKVASGKGNISLYEQTVLRAAARAGKSTGVPIITHTEQGTMGPEQAELLLSEGADPKQILIGHMSDNTDVRYQMRTLAKGVYVGFDRMGLQLSDDYPSDAERYPVLIGLIASGFAEQIMLSHDYSAVSLGRSVAVLREQPRFANYYPTHIFKRVIPTLRERGVTEQQINTLILDNPRRLFGGR